jgi:hypothetical protein
MSTSKEHGKPVLMLPFVDPETMVTVPEEQATVEAGRERDALELPLTRAVDTRVEMAWNSALNWTPDSKEVKDS